MTYEEYRLISLKRQAQIMMVADCNTIIDKLTMWDNKGKDNPVWQTMPSLSAGANKEDRIFDDVPYAIGLSNYTSSLLEELVAKQPIGANGGKPCPVKIADDTILPMLSITTQFAILEYFEVEQYRQALQNGKLFDIDTDKFFLKDISTRGLDTMIAGRVKALTDNYSLKGVAKRVTSSWKAISVAPMDEDDAKLYSDLADRRNELTHEINCPTPDLDEAKTYFENCNKIAKIIKERFAGGTTAI